MKITVFMALSLDGFIADDEGGVEWLNQASASAAPNEDFGYDALIQSVDRLVMGRNTFNQVLEFGSWPYGDLPVSVLSHRSPPNRIPEGAVVNFIQGNPGLVVDFCKSAGDKHIYLDGGQVVQQFLEAGLLNEIILTQVPVLLGHGISLFKEAFDATVWKLERVSNYSNGFIQTCYIKKESGY